MESILTPEVRALCELASHEPNPDKLLEQQENSRKKLEKATGSSAKSHAA
jgi:hypothetical protein